MSARVPSANGRNPASSSLGIRAALPPTAISTSNLTDSDVTVGSAETYFIPTDFGSTAIAYNSDEVPEEDVASLNVFTNPAYAGRMTLPDNVDDAYALAYLATGTTNWTDIDDAAFEAATAWLREVHPNLRTYWTDPAELAQLLATGEVLVSWAWNETLPTMVEQGFPIGFQRQATEGSSLWLCGYVNLVDGEGSEDKAYDYINAMLDPASTAPLLAEGFRAFERRGNGRSWRRRADGFRPWPDSGADPGTTADPERAA